MCIFGVIAVSPYSSVDRSQHFKRRRSAIVISVDDIENCTKRLQATTNFIQHSTCSRGKKSLKQKTEKYIVQFIYCSAVRKFLVLMDTGSRPSLDGTSVLEGSFYLDKALGRRKLRPIHKYLAKCFAVPKKDYALDLSRAFQSGKSMTNQVKQSNDNLVEILVFPFQFLWYTLQLLLHLI